MCTLEITPVSNHWSNLERIPKRIRGSTLESTPMYEVMLVLMKSLNIACLSFVCDVLLFEKSYNLRIVYVYIHVLRTDNSPMEYYQDSKSNIATLVMAMRNDITINA